MGGSKIVHRGTWMGLTSYTVVHGWVTFPSKLVHGWVMGGGTSKFPEAHPYPDQSWVPPPRMQWHNVHSQSGIKFSLSDVPLLPPCSDRGMRGEFLTTITWFKTNLFFRLFFFSPDNYYLTWIILSWKGTAYFKSSHASKYPIKWHFNQSL